MSHELHRRYRPKILKHVIGQPQAVSVIQGWLKKSAIPHAILLTGSSGCGKTTIARILAAKLEAHTKDIAEQNCADARGIDTIRDITRRAGMHPIGKARVCILDEVHQLPTASQNALLKTLEEPQKTAYFFLCTTDPQKLLKTIVTRCSELRINALANPDVQALIESICERESLTLAKSVILRIVDAADGSARKALNLIDTISEIEGEEDQIEAIHRSDHRRDGIEICRALLDQRTRWVDFVGILGKCDLSEPEGLRRQVLGYAGAVLIGGRGNCARAAAVIHYMRDHVYDSGKAGFVANCYEILATK